MHKGYFQNITLLLPLRISLYNSNVQLSLAMNCSINFLTERVYPNQLWKSYSHSHTKIKEVEAQTDQWHLNLWGTDSRNRFVNCSVIHSLSVLLGKEEKYSITPAGEWLGIRNISAEIVSQSTCVTKGWRMQIENPIKTGNRKSHFAVFRTLTFADLISFVSQLHFHPGFISTAYDINDLFTSLSSPWDNHFSQSRDLSFHDWMLRA